MVTALIEKLTAFVEHKGFRGKGPLSVALVVTDHAKKRGLPLDPERLLTGKRGQVLGLSRSAVQAILKRYNIDQVLAKEGGRTSRGSLENMREYVHFLNELENAELSDLDEVEGFWIERVKLFFSGKPLKIKLDGARSLRHVIQDVIEQAQDRQRSMPGMQYAGAVLQHLVGAKLDWFLGTGRISHNSFSTADAPSNRVGDFLAGDVAIHVTTSPGESVLQKCRDNLNQGYRPILVTLQQGVPVAQGLAANVQVSDRVDIFEIEQFLALNLYEHGKFEAKGRQVAIEELVARYNKIVEEFETDPSLAIEFRK